MSDKNLTRQGTESLNQLYSVLAETTYFIKRPKALQFEEAYDAWSVPVLWGLVDNGAEKTWLFFVAPSNAVVIDLLKRLVDAALPVNVLILSTVLTESIYKEAYTLKQLKNHLQQRFNLVFATGVDCRVSGMLEEGDVEINSGFTGQLQPFVLVKGDVSAAYEPFSGLSSLGILMEVVKAIELNTEMCDRAFGQMSAPPTFLGLGDIRCREEAATPPYAAGYFNWPYYTEHIGEKFNQLKALVVWSAEDAINQYNYSYNEYLRKQRKPSYQNCQEIPVEVLLYEELIAQYNGVFPMNTECALEGTLDIVKHMVATLERNHPVIVMGLLPTAYPSQDNDAFFSAVLFKVLEVLGEKTGVQWRHRHYSRVPSVLSFFDGKSHPSEIMRAKMPLEPDGHYMKALEEEERSMPCVQVTFSERYGASEAAQKFIEQLIRELSA